LIDSGAAQSADSCLASDTEVAGSLDQDLVDGITVDGSVYQIPWYVTPNALFYNADLFTKAGLDPDAPPTTMSEFHDAATAIAATGAAGGTAYFGNDYNFQTYVASLGARVYDPATGDLAIGSDEGAAVFDAFARMAADGSSPVYSNFFAEANEAFAGGSLGMIVTSASGYPALKASGNVDIRIAPVPAMDGGEQIAATSTNGFVITTKDPARQAAVCDALLSLLTPQAVTDTVTATATIPLLTSTIDDEAYLAPVYAANPDWVAVRDQPTFAWASLPGGASAEYSSAYVDDQLKALRGDVSGADAASELQATAEQLLKAN
ncbi:MAG: extracellular solute-binding protein, partial [Herbiconiux sp.]|nr:extracellular solute-binding protein [Herbiconiux sp.]